MIPAIRTATMVSIKVKPEAETRRTLVDDPKRNARLDTGPSGRLSQQGWVRLALCIFMLIGKRFNCVSIQSAAASFSDCPGAGFFAELQYRTKTKFGTAEIWRAALAR
jgi:hypothetical protein